jgi:hypothetical protein
MDERRQLPRWEIKKETKIWSQQVQGFVHGIIEDMHLKGMCLSFDKKLFEGDFVNLSFALGEGFDLIKVEAQIPWAKEEQGRHVYGLSFNKIADSDKDRIYQYISTNCADQFKNKWWS